MSSLEELVARRHSVRGFVNSKPVPREVVQGALELAQRSPSNCNAQPWRIYLVDGERCDRLRRALLQAARAPDPAEPVVSATPDFQGIYRQRQVQCAVELYQQMGVARDDRPGRKAAFLRNFELFDAPHVALVCMPKEFGKQVALDVGCWLMTFLLALEERGVQSCAQAALRCFPKVLQQEVGVAPELEVLCGVSFGYEAPDVPANRTRQGRAPISENVTWVE